jgi:hypothetical protein
MTVWSGNFNFIRSLIVWNHRVYLLRICVILPDAVLYGALRQHEGVADLLLQQFLNDLVVRCNLFELVAGLVSVLDHETSGRGVAPLGVFDRTSDRTSFITARGPDYTSIPMSDGSRAAVDGRPEKNGLLHNKSVSAKPSDAHADAITALDRPTPIGESHPIYFALLRRTALA